MAYCKYIFVAVLGFSLAACSKGGGGPTDPHFSENPSTAFTITDESELIGGPVAQGRVGDILLQNDKIRVIIQKPRKNSGVNSFGGNIIDADLVRAGGDAGADNFGSLFPLVNIEWAVNYRDFEVVSGADGKGAKVLRAKGTIDVYDYLDLDFITDVAEGIAGQKISFSNRFDDRRNPFEIYDDMKGLSPEVITQYTLDPGANYVRIDTTFENTGDKEVRIPVGYFMNGSGENSMLIPGVGFSPDLMTQIGANTPAVIYAAFDAIDVSYGFFFSSTQFMNTDQNEPYATTSITYSGVTGLLLGEEFLKLAPLGGGGIPEIHFSIPPKGKRAVTGYFVVGNGSAGSVMDAGLNALGAASRPISGKVLTADNKPVAGATVAVMSKGQTLITYRTDNRGRFAGNLPNGGDRESKRFGGGRYTVAVEVPGYHKNETTDAGKCSPNDIDLVTKEAAYVECVLGETAAIAISKPVSDAETGRAIAARLTIVGEDPSPNKTGNAGRFRSSIDFEQPFGIVDIKYITAMGTVDLTGESRFRIEPGDYLLVISHGPEYGTYERVVNIPASGEVTIDDVKLSRAVHTPGFVGADFHVHSVKSADSSMSQEMRVLSASAEGLDVLHSSDHDFIADYAPVVRKLEEAGIIPAGGMQTASGDEVTPNHYGHLNAFPLEAVAEDPDGGAVDWSDSDHEDVSFAPDFVRSLDDLIAKLRQDPGEEVIQINHIMDDPTGIFSATGWVTTPYYINAFGALPLASYADPVERRMLPHSAGASFPLPLGTTGLSTLDFDAVELAIGLTLNEDSTFFRSALPTWFNLLNLGVIVTATADSDTHRPIADPIGLPRNFILSSTDPRDGSGSDYRAIDLEEYAANIRAHHATISAGPIVFIRAKSETGNEADIGGTLVGRNILLTVDVKAPSWGWFDTIEIYANTDPIPVDDKTDAPMQGTAANPAEFYKPYHTPRYSFEPVKSFKLTDGSLENWKEENGVISAKINIELKVEEDTWVVAMARGTRQTKGYRSLFPIATAVLADPNTAPENFDPANLEAFHADRRVGACAWGLTNPIFIDSDGNGFLSKYVRQGISPVR